MARLLRGREAPKGLPVRRNADDPRRRSVRARRQLGPGRRDRLRTERRLRTLRRLRRRRDARRVTKLDFAAGDDGTRWPQVLPGRHAALFTVLCYSRETLDVFLVDLGTGARRLVQAGADFVRYVPSAPGAAAGHLVFVRAGTLVAAPFDPARAELAGPAVAVVERVQEGAVEHLGERRSRVRPGHRAALDYSLVKVDRTGRATPINDQARGYEDLNVSPDGRRVALTIEEPGQDLSAAHVWLGDLERGTLTRFTFEGYSRDPVWAPDGETIVYGSRRGESGFGLYRQRLDGRTPAELIWASPIPIWPDPQSFFPDGKTVVFTTKGKETSDDIWTLSLDGERTARPWLATPATEWAGRLSPDGRFMAYCSNETGRDEVHVQPFPGPGGKRIVSRGAASTPSGRATGGSSSTGTTTRSSPSTWRRAPPSRPANPSFSSRAATATPAGTSTCRRMGRASS